MSHPASRMPRLLFLPSLCTLALACVFTWSAPAQAQAQGLPPLPKAVSPSAASKGKTPLAAMSAAASPTEAPLLAAMPKDVAKAAAPCAALDEKAADWLRESMAIMQAQTLRPNGSPKAREAFADLWLAFKSWRDKGYDLDGYGLRVDTVYRALYPAGSFSPDSPFERFKEPRWACRKIKQQAAAAALAASAP